MMVEQMVNSKLIKYGLGNYESITISCDEQPLVAIKNTALQDVQNCKRTGLPRLFENHALKKETKSVEAVTQVLIAKCPMPDSLSSPPCVQSPAATNVNQHLVYARRKSDAEVVNCRNSDKNNGADFPQAEQLSDKTVNPQPQANTKEVNSNSVSRFTPIPANSTATSCGSGTQLPDPFRKRDHGQSPRVNGVPSSDKSGVTADQHWIGRFNQLQNYLKQCDNSNQHSYIQKLRSLTLDERSRHAVELERRAMYLMLEEGREIQRMKELVILGQSAADHSPLPHTPILKSEK